MGRGRIGSGRAAPGVRAGDAGVGGGVPGGRGARCRGVDNPTPHDYQWRPRLSRVRVGHRVGSGVVMLAVVMQIAVACQRGSNDPLAVRAAKYWELKQQKRWEEVYDAYLDPELKSTLRKDAFLKKRLLAFDILTFTVTDATENGSEGTVHVKIDANIPLRAPGGKVEMRRQEMTSEDSWVRRNGTWYIRLTE